MLKAGECFCINELSFVAESCTQFNEMEGKVKIARKKCTNQQETGSFGDCRIQERKVSYYGEKCKSDCPATITTKVRRSSTIF